MKRFFAMISAWFLCVCLMSCGELTAYNLGEFLPPLTNIETQYPYVETIVVTKLETGESVELTEWMDHNIIRMQFEELQCVRREKTVQADKGFSVTFVTVGEDVTVLIPVEEGAYQADYVYIGEYEYEMLAYGVDLFCFESLFD